MVCHTLFASQINDKINNIMYWVIIVSFGTNLHKVIPSKLATTAYVVYVKVMSPCPKSGSHRCPFSNGWTNNPYLEKNLSECYSWYTNYGKNKIEISNG
jgi:hypothetical protein